MLRSKISHPETLRNFQEDVRSKLSNPAWREELDYGASLKLLRVRLQTCSRRLRQAGEETAKKQKHGFETAASARRVDKSKRACSNEHRGRSEEEILSLNAEGLPTLRRTRGATLARFRKKVSRHRAVESASRGEIRNPTDVSTHWILERRKGDSLVKVTPMSGKATDLLLDWGETIHQRQEQQVCDTPRLKASCDHFQKTESKEMALDRITTERSPKHGSQSDGHPECAISGVRGQVRTANSTRQPELERNCRLDWRYSLPWVFFNSRYVVGSDRMTACIEDTTQPTNRGFARLEKSCCAES